MKKYLLIFLILNSICYSQWEQTNGPKGAYITVILPHPDGTIYIGAYAQGIFKSTDGGLTWIDISVYPLVEATCMTYDSQYVYLGTNYNGIYRTSDKGTSWESVTPVGDNYISSIYAVQGKVFASSNSWLYVSTNFGTSWNQLNLNQDCYTITYKSGYLIAGTNYGVNSGVWRSSDFGASWEQSATTFNPLYYPELAVNNNDIYLVGRYSLYRSTDNALNWDSLNFPSHGYGNSITFQNNYLFLASDSGLYKSSDFGISWSLINFSNPVSYVTKIVSANNVLFAGTFLSIFRSLDNGLLWKSVNYDFHRESITQLIAYGNNVLAGLNDGVFFSSNNGYVWKECMNIRGWAFVTSFAFSGNNVYTGMYNERILKSTNNGWNWSQIPNTGPNYSRVMCLYAQGSQLLAGFNPHHTPMNGGIWYSSNSGLNWITTGNGTNVAVNDVAINNNYLYAGTTRCLRVSTNYGSTWDTLIHSGVSNIEFSPQYTFVSTFNGLTNHRLKRSSDNGMTWLDINNGLDTNHTFKNLLYANNRLYVTADTIGIFVSTNNGDLWYSFNDGLTDLTINKISANDVYIFAATGSGVWRRPVGELLKISSERRDIPERFSLYQNYPNPFNSTTKIKFDIPEKSEIRNSKSEIKLIIYDILGRELVTLVNEKLSPGTYEVEWNASNYPSGVYFYKITAGDFLDSRKMILMK